jgi:hypothetical protein
MPDALSGRLRRARPRQAAYPSPAQDLRTLAKVEVAILAFFFFDVSHYHYCTQRMRGIGIYLSCALQRFSGNFVQSILWYRDHLLVHVGSLHTSGVLQCLQRHVARSLPKIHKSLPLHCVLQGSTGPPRHPNAWSAKIP